MEFQAEGLKGQSLESTLDDLQESINFSFLPVLLLKYVVSYLPLLDKLNFSQTCHTWRSFMVDHSSYVWKSICIDPSSAFGGVWREVNSMKKIKALERGGQRFAKEMVVRQELKQKQMKKRMDQFLTRLNCVTAGSIENITIINIRLSFAVTPEVVYNLLRKQMKIISLRLNVYFIYPMEMDYPQLENNILATIEKHQATLKVIEISNNKFPLAKLAHYLTNAEFPNLKAISCGLYGVSNSSDEAAAVNFYTNMLKHGKVEEINTNRWIVWDHKNMLALKSALSKGLTPNLKKLDLGSTLYITAIQEADTDMITKNCPKLTHLNFDSFFSFDQGRIDSSAQSQSLMMMLPRLAVHYSKNILFISCQINDSIAEAISVYCCNLTTLIAVVANDFQLEFNLQGAPQFPRRSLTDKGLLALSKLKKLQNFYFRLENFKLITMNGVIEFLRVSVDNFKELSLHLPISFYNDSSAYDILKKGNANLQQLSLSAHWCGLPEDNLSQLNAIMYLRHMEELIKNYRCLKNLYLNMFTSEDVELSLLSETNSVVRKLFETIVTFHPRLKSLTIFIQNFTPLEADMDYIANNLPCCEISWKLLVAGINF